MSKSINIVLSVLADEMQEVFNELKRNSSPKLEIKRVAETSQQFYARMNQTDTDDLYVYYDSEQIPIHEEFLYRHNPTTVKIYPGLAKLKKLIKRTRGYTQ